MSKDSFQAKATLEAGGKKYSIYRLDALQKQFPGVAKLPLSLKVLLESLVRKEDDLTVRKADIEALCTWKADSTPDKEIAFYVARVLLQDYTGVPCVTDLASMRDALKKLGGDPKRVNPLCP